MTKVSVKQPLALAGSVKNIYLKYIYITQLKIYILVGLGLKDAYMISDRKEEKICEKKKKS